MAIKGDCFNNDLTKLEQMRFKMLLRLLQKKFVFLATWIPKKQMPIL